MELTDAVRGRRTIRRFLPDPVPYSILRDLVDISHWAPSWGNTMPFELVAATGPPLDQFKFENRNALLAGIPTCPDVPMPQDWPLINKKRYKAVGRLVLEAQGIARDDQNGRLEYYTRMFSLFDAPALVLVLVEDTINLEYAMLDAGLFLQTFCLAAHDRGLGTCILAAAVQYSDLVRRHFSISKNRRIVIGVGLGYPDWNDSINQFDRPRPAVEETMRIIK